MVDQQLSYTFLPLDMCFERMQFVIAQFQDCSNGKGRYRKTQWHCPNERSSCLESMGCLFTRWFSSLQVHGCLG